MDLSFLIDVNKNTVLKKEVHRKFVEDGVSHRLISVNVDLSDSFVE